MDQTKVVQTATNLLLEIQSILDQCSRLLGGLKGNDGANLPLSSQKLLPEDNPSNAFQIDDIKLSLGVKKAPGDIDNRWKLPQSEFIYETLVTIKDTNFEGNVYFSNYLSWQGESREVLLLSHPNIQEEMKNNYFIKLITHTVHHRFIEEAHFGDMVQIKIKTKEIKKCSFILEFRFSNKRTGALLGEGWQRIAILDNRTGKICPIPSFILDLIEPIRNNDPLAGRAKNDN